MQQRRVVKPKNQKAKRFLLSRDPKLVENAKRTMFIRGSNCNETMTSCLKDMYSLKKPNASIYKRKNLLRPFEDPSSIEFFSHKTDSSLFMFGSHNKKRPYNAIIGRLFDYGILDMIELGINNYIPMKMFKTIKPSVGAKPCIVFTGDVFETEHVYMVLKNLLIDFFRGEEASSVDLSGFEYVISITAVDEIVHFRVYRIFLKKSGQKNPRVELKEMGPRFDFKLRRTLLARTEKIKETRKKPRAAMQKKVKNKKMDAFGSKMGQIHMTRQDYTQLNTRRMKGLKRKRGNEKTKELNEEETTMDKKIKEQ